MCILESAGATMFLSRDTCVKLLIKFCKWSHMFRV
ncbi:hypothetical protein CASFOL_016357 [Castilleja foliolosa]|uniref:Uncharacterized protein n=1 Tax=Castilleja foliolosa TaxID=1961234 RepID=A0ABD3DJV8_9LAMI